MMFFDPSRKRTKVLASVTSLLLLTQLFHPTIAIGQSSGSESTDQAGSPSGTTDMVNLFTGDFSYSIPLLNVEGYPLVLNYNGNTSMNSEASWVGLGWGLNPGSVNRNKRGLPDDFDGDEVKKDIYFRDMIMDGKNGGAGLNVSVGFPVGIFQLGVSGSFEFKNGPFSLYDQNGRNHEYLLGLGLSAGAEFPNNSSSEGMNLGIGGNASWGKKRNTITGISRSSSLSGSFSLGYSESDAGLSLGGNIGRTDYSTSRGIRARMNTAGYSASVYAINDHTYDGNYKDYKGTKYTSTGSGQSVGANGGATISYGTKAYTPSIIYDMNASSSFFRISGGYYGYVVPPPILPTVFTWGYGLFENYNTTQVLSDETLSNPAYGYCNLENSVGKTDAIRDFNRAGGEQTITDKSKFLPSTNITYDIFYASASGYAQSFRAYRNDIGTVANNRSILLDSGKSNVISVGAGVGGPGVAYKATYTNGRQNKHGQSGEWNYATNAAINKLRFKDVENQGDQSSETFYFQAIGERLPYDSSFYDQYGGENPIKIGMTNDEEELSSSAKFKEYSFHGRNYQGLNNLPSNNYRSAKQDRQSMISFLTAGQADVAGLNKSILSHSLYSTGSDGSYTVDERDRVTDKHKKSHHISEFTIIKDGGQRLVYGIPAYTLKQEEITFNASNRNKSCNSGLTTYGANDNSSSNQQGRNHLYTKTTTPAHANNYLISAILSPDYSDRYADGPTEDDFGSYVKFNYTAVYDSSNVFKWRTPISEDSAVAIENYKYYDDDDLASYLYGEKELWYVHSVEGKEYIAEFYLSDREDLYSVIDENGGIDTGKPAKKLDKIVLYHKDDRRKNGTNATPIKTVHFVYDYSLCRNYPGNSNTGVDYSRSGKLTLKEVYFTFGNSEKGRLSPYKFSYNSNNPDYQPGNMDRWNVFKQNNCSDVSNADYPYASRDRAERDTTAAAWCMDQVQLPSGGAISISYESDDYAFVQDRRAMEMFPVEGAGTTSTDYAMGTSNKFRESNDKTTPNDVLFVTLPETLASLTPGPAKQEFYEKYLEEILQRHRGKIYYKFNVDLDNDGNYEYVPGYAKVIDWGIAGSSPYGVGWIQVESNQIHDYSGHKINPIMRKSWQYVRRNIPRVIYPGQGPNALSVDEETLNSSFHEAMDSIGFCQRFERDKSFVRLLSPEHEKLGGRNRVKSITMSDSWSNMKGDSDFSYGQEYEYNLESGQSSGVAAYEPTVGNDVNPFRQPVGYVVNNSGFPDDFLYHEYPMCEDLFPSPTVGYSRVKVKSLDHQNVTQNAVGYTIHEYYTQKDAPIQVSYTPLSSPVRYDYVPSKWDILVGAPLYNTLGLSQGYSIKKNDIHGKSKKVTSYGANGNEISSVEYIYKPIGGHCKIINRDGGIESAVLGRTIDVVSDMQYNKMRHSTSSTTVGVQAKASWPMPVFNSYSSSRTSFLATMVVTKQVHDYMILDKVVTSHLGAQATRENEAYDKHTGEVLVSSTQNEFSDASDYQYALSYPSHWYYDGMSNASKTWNNHFEADIDANGKLDLSALGINPEDYLEKGDEILIQGTSLDKYWVIDIDTSSNLVLIVDADGTQPSQESDISVRVIRSGHRNQMSLTMASVSTMSDPVSGPSVSVSDVLSASAVEFDEEWQIRCGDSLGCSVSSYVCDSAGYSGCSWPDECCETISQSDPTCGFTAGDYVNPYRLGILGNWRLNKSYTYKTNRAQTSTSSSTNIRSDGAYGSFTPFYEYNNTDDLWYPIYSIDHPSYSGTDTENWVLNSTILQFDERGRPITSRNAINKHAAVLYGYNEHTENLPIAIATNAMRRDIAYDGFEDYLYRSDVLSDTCKLPGHLSFAETLKDQSIDSAEAHTGRYSLRVLPGANHSVTRYITDCVDDGRHGLNANGYRLKGCDCIDRFSPREGKYTIGAWLMEVEDSLVETYANAQLRVVVSDGNGDTLSNDAFTASNQIIDGWQRIEGEFTVGSTASCIEVTLEHPSGSTADAAYFDDLRIHPFNSVMTSFVYDPYSLRKWAELNDYNYSTLYEYDERGMLVRVKVETIEGISTVSETRSGVYK